MKILVVFATKNGVSKTCAEMLCRHLNKHDVLCVNVADNPPAPNDYDVAVVGGSIRMGKLNPKLKQYIQTNREALEQMNAAFFMCCGFSEEYEDYLETQLPRGITFSLGCHYFGGEMKPQKLKGLDKLIVMLIKGHLKSKNFGEGSAYEPMLPEIIPEHISILADRIRDLSV